MYTFIINILTLFILFGCGAGVSDMLEEIPNGYVYEDEAPKQKWIMKNPLSINSNLYIPCQVLKYKYNDKYVIAKIKFHYDMNCVVGFIESKHLKEGKIYYYIIDTTKNIRYGVFDSYKNFNQMLKTLNIGLTIGR